LLSAPDGTKDRASGKKDQAIDRWEVPGPGQLFLFCCGSAAKTVPTVAAFQSDWLGVKPRFRLQRSA
jgi:hypothetical protein